MSAPLVHPRRADRVLAGLVAAPLLCLVALLTVGTAPASAHVVPTSSVRLDVRASSVEATVTIPLDDLAAASGLDLGAQGAQTQADVDAQADAVSAYLLEHFAPTSDDGVAWSVVEDTPLVVSDTGDTTTTGLYEAVTTTFTLTPPAGDTVLTSFDLGWDAVVDRVATHHTVVTASTDGGPVSEVGVVGRSTVSNTVTTLHVDLGAGSGYRGFVSMVRLGMQHIQEGTDHQLFLLTLLLPAPLLLRARRWGAAASARHAVRRITAITLAFTLGHSVTLALGTLGLPVPQGLVEAAIAASIVVAGLHAVRPIFPGREAWVAAAFGLVHGLAFSEALRELDLSGRQLVAALLGFNLGIEAMQLLVVALVLPPLVVLARSGHYTVLRVTASVVTIVAAAGWLCARLGFANPVADLADQLGTLSVPVAVALWLAAVAVRLRRVRRAAVADTSDVSDVAINDRALTRSS